MYEHYTVMLKENSSDNLKVLTEKLNEGYHIDSRYEVGRSTLLILQKRVGTQSVTPSARTGSGAIRGYESEQTEAVSTRRF